MRIADLGQARLQRSLTGRGLYLRTGPFTSRIQSPIASVARGIESLYRDFEVADHSSFYDFHCELRAPRSHRRFYRPQVLFLADRRSVFKPLAYHQAYPMFEWGLNWCIANQVPHRLVLHAAALERDGKALVLPAPPGSGKSTLCAALAHHGWRLLTDESVLVDLASSEVSGPARPVSLKNDSIRVIRDACPSAVLSTPIADTLKGAVAHMRPPTDAVRRSHETARPGWIVFPHYQPGASTQLKPRTAGSGFMQLIANAFNYAALGARGFHSAGRLVEQSACFDFSYSRLDEAIEQINRLADGR
ncbi:HprK-related kinase A [Thioalkalivibrio sp. ALgr1]|uniref:HprK-related kinase A n=1 Tax=Thioalkalivibrio sp. ALgr1 TaxID=748655 RepID=UPI0003674DCC|nr:HprK-related kinase A [Thioalkalivibrio sp. ALgr1]